MKFLPSNPGRAYLLPPSVKGHLGENRRSFLIHGLVEELDLNVFEADGVEEGWLCNRLPCC